MRLFTKLGGSKEADSSPWDLLMGPSWRHWWAAAHDRCDDLQKRELLTLTDQVTHSAQGIGQGGAVPLSEICQYLVTLPSQGPSLDYQQLPKAILGVLE